MHTFPFPTGLHQATGFLLLKLLSNRELQGEQRGKNRGLRTDSYIRKIINNICTAAKTDNSMMNANPTNRKDVKNYILDSSVCRYISLWPLTGNLFIYFEIANLHFWCMHTWMGEIESNIIMFKSRFWYLGTNTHYCNPNYRMKCAMKKKTALHFSSYTHQILIVKRTSFPGIEVKRFISSVSCPELKSAMFYLKL